MAVDIQINIPLAELMQKLGCSEQLISAAFEAGLVSEVKSDSVLVITTALTPMKSGVAAGVNAAAPIKLGVLQQIVNGTIGKGASQNLAKISLEKAVKSVLGHTTVEIGKPGFLKSSADLAAKIGDLSEALQNAVDANTPVVDALEGLSKSKVFNPEGKPQSEAAKATDALGNATVAPPKVLSMNKVKLKYATALFQPVRGSDPGSIYYTVALRDDLKVALRIKGYKLSMRVEGEIGKYQSKLSNAGLNGNSDHYSIHLAADDGTLLLKSAGALLFGMGIHFPLAASDLLPIYNKGA
jgi:hypothetical protein